MEVLETKKHLPGDQLNKGLRDTLFLVTLNESQEALSKGLKNDTYVIFRPNVSERVKEGDDVSTTRMSGIYV